MAKTTHFRYKRTIPGGKIPLAGSRQSEHELLPGHKFITHKVTQHLLLINTTTKRSSQR